METFAQKFLKIYDRRILSGEITFSQSGISKNEFTRLCTDGSFVIEREALETICDRMKVTEEERRQLLEYTE